MAFSLLDWDILIMIKYCILSMVEIPHAEKPLKIISNQCLKQARAELGQAQLQLELGFTLITVCCITLMITNYHYISL